MRKAHFDPLYLLPHFDDFPSSVTTGYAILLDAPWVRATQNIGVPVVQGHGVHLDEDVGCAGEGDGFGSGGEVLGVGASAAVEGADLGHYRGVMEF